MKSKLINNGGNDALLIFFAGWSIEPESLDTFRPKGWDVLFIYDYSELSFPIEAVAAITEYSRFSLIAHSFGVAVAHSFREQLPIMESTIAVCGTLLPISDKYGIPKRLFDLTIKSIGKEGIELFNRRMCGNNLSGYKYSTLDFNSQIEALKLLGERFSRENDDISLEEKDYWKVAVICMLDEIIPVDNQVAFWGESSSEVVGFKTQPHYPFTSVFSQFITSII